MKDKIRIAPILVMAGLLLASAPTLASAAGPLLSGYGGPGAGEQTLVGSTLLGGPHGGAGSGGSSDSAGVGGAGVGGSARSLSGGAGSISTGVGGTRAGSTGGSTAAGGDLGAPHAGGGAPGARADTSAFVYPTSPRSASGNPSALAISVEDLLLLLGLVAVLAVIGTFTIRLTRLQP